MTVSIGKLNSAIGAGNIDLVRECLKEDIDINDQEPRGWAPLDCASGIDKQEPRGWRPIDWISRINAEPDIANQIVKLLLDKGADPLLADYKGKYIFESIFRNKKHDIFTILLAHLNKTQQINLINLGETPLLFYIIKFGGVEDLKIFVNYLDENTDVLKLGKEQLWLTEFKGKIPLFYFIKQQKISLIEEREQQKIELIEYLIEESFRYLDLDDEEISVILNYLIKFDYHGTVLVKFIDNYLPDLNSVNNENENYLHYAVKANNFYLVGIFIERGLDVNQKNKHGDTPLILAIKKIQSLVSFFREEGHENKNVSMSDEQEVIDNLYIIKKLILNGADVNIINAKNESALSIARQLPKRLNLEAIINKSIYFYNLRENYFNCREKIREKNQDFFEHYLSAPEVANFIEDKICRYLNETEKEPETQSNAIKKLQEILTIIENLKYTDYYHIKIHELIIEFLGRRAKRNYKVYDRFGKEVNDTPLDAEKYYYTFLDTPENGSFPAPYKLTLVTESPPDYYLITSLVYEGIRHTNYEAHPNCQLLRRLIIKIDNTYKNFSLKEFNQKLVAIETENRNFFGENISDNSDSEQEIEYKKLPQRKKHFTYAYVESFFKKSQPEKLFVKKERKLKSSIETVKYDLAKRQEIHREMPNIQVQRDLEKLNMLAIGNELNEETIKTISTKFCVAQYRGISYRVDHWNKPTRKQHRKLDEKGQPLFSFAAISLGGFENYSKYVDAVETNPNTVSHLITVAENLKQQLLQLQKSGPVTVKFNNKERIYENALLALQACYTNAYDGFHNLLEKFSDKFITHEPVEIKTLEEAILLSLSHKFSPFTSTSDTPDHALRYGYSDKFYSSYKDKRLRPRWRADGKCERPYSGKVYVSLHDPLALITGSHHVVSLANRGKISVGYTIMSEREMSFLSYIPEGRVISQHVAKFPSFHGEYKEIYFEKYGLNKELYDQFKERIINSAPHSNQNKAAKRLLTAHLISYHEVCLIEEAKIAANNSGRVLIYRNEYGGFSFIPSQSFEPGNDKKRKLSIQKSNQHKKQKRAEVRDEGEGFLTRLTQKFTYISDGISENSLIKSLSILLEISIDELTHIKMNTREEYKNELFLEKIHEMYQVNIHIHSPAYENGIKQIGEDEDKQAIHLYHLGGDFFSALESKETGEKKLKRSHFFESPNPKRQAQAQMLHVESDENNMSFSW